MCQIWYNNHIFEFFKSKKNKQKITRKLALGRHYQRVSQNYFVHWNNYLRFNEINPQAPVAQKVADGVVFRRFRREGVEFF